MSAPVNIAALLLARTEAQILKVGLELAKALKLPVDTWSPGDPTRSLYHFVARVLAASDGVIAEYVKAGFLSTAQGDWLKVLAWEVYGVPFIEASYATPTITVENTGGGHFVLGAGGFTARNSETNKTYHNTSAIVIAAGATVTIDLVADEAGSDSSVGINEIDELVTSLLGVEVVSSTAALANDEETPEALRDRCRASLGALSPAGPADAYAFIALTPSYTGTTAVNRARATGTSTGSVTTVIATPSGAADASAIAAVQAACLKWATPLCVSHSTVSAAVAAQSLNLTVYKAAGFAASTAEISTAVQTAFVKLFAATKIGGTNGGIAESVLTGAVHAAFPGQIDRVTGLSDIALASNEVPTLGAIVVTVL